MRVDSRNVRHFRLPIFGNIHAQALARIDRSTEIVDSHIAVIVIKNIHRGRRARPRGNEVPVPRYRLNNRALHGGFDFGNGNGRQHNCGRRSVLRRGRWTGGRHRRRVDGGR